MAIEFKTGDFVQVQGDSLEGNGIPAGSFLYLAGDTFIRESEDDPYLFRRAFVAARVVDLHIQANEKPFLITAKNLVDVSENDLGALVATYEQDFGEDEE
ncbi:hypothetical protein D3C71_1173420 [compost metagenome]